jgi:hypothetical protein
MKHLQSRKLILAGTGAAILLASLAFGITKARTVMYRRKEAATIAARRDRLPHLMLWAWERPTDLRFINPKEIGVAFLARTIRLQGGEIAVRQRLQPLDLPDSTTVIAVVRVETDSAAKPELSAAQWDRLAGAIADMTKLYAVANVQIDFDATQSERQFYRDLIFDVRRRLPDNVGLSITALGSWCTYDSWFSDLPIDDAVPMLFRMAGDGKQIANRLAAGDDFIAPQCRHSYGISMDEPRSNLLSSRRLYVFNPNSWTESSVRKILESGK